MKALAPSVLLMAYGSPNSLGEVGDFLTQIRGGRIPTPEEVEHLKDRYRQVGGQTPLLTITELQAKALEKKLQSSGTPAKVYFGMKHWRPFIEDVVPKIVMEGASSIVGLALAPHYSKLSIGGYEDAVNRGLARAKYPVPFTMVKSWHTQESLIRELSRRVREGLQKMDSSLNAVVLFTAHSLPKKFVPENDPYEKQLRETSALVAARSEVKSWEFAFQSAGEPVESWLGPQIREKVSELAGKGVKGILVCPVGFTSDHLEILYDLDIDAKRYSSSLGVKLARTDSLNDDPEFVEAMASPVRPLLASEPAMAVKISGFQTAF